MKKKFTLFLVVLFLTSSGWSRSFRKDQIPNGNKFSCSTCHTGYGGPRNDFGQTIEADYLDTNGNVIWGPELAALDSDGDGGTNGTELLDPQGIWITGNENPGEASDVSNPGNASSISAVQWTAENPSRLQLAQNYPNPFNASTRIDIHIAKAEYTSIIIYNVNGTAVQTLESSVLQPGTYSYQWNGNHKEGMELTSGVYLLKMQSGSFSKTIRMLMVK